MSKGYVLLIAALGLVIALCVISVGCSQPKQSAQRHNGYWPYSVETVVRDR